MTSASAATGSGALCRLALVGPERRIDVAVPTGIPVGDLLPVLLRQLGEELADTGLEHQGWALQRFGEPPFDEDADVEGLGLRDGDTIYLRPRADHIPAIDFDDMIDGIATGMAERSGRWTPAATRRACVGGLTLVLLAGFVVLALPGPVLPRLVLAAAATATLVAGAASLGHAGSADRDGWSISAALLAAAAAGTGSLAGWLLPGVLNPAAPGTAAGTVGLRLLCAGTAALVIAALTRAALGRASGIFALLTPPAVLTMLGGILVGLAGMTVTAVAAALLVVVIGATVLVPMLAFRLAGLRLAPLPVTGDDLQEDIEPEASAPLLAGAARVDTLMTSLYGGLGAAATAAGVVLAARPAGPPWVLATVAALVLLLSVRPMTSARHRLAIGGSGALIVAVAFGTAAVHAPPVLRYAVLGSAVMLAAATLIWAVRALPGRRLMPYWGRAGDILQALAGAALLPLLLWLLGVYGRLRGIGG